MKKSKSFIHVAIMLLLSFAVVNLCAQIQLLNDEFSDSATVSNWININQDEGWNITQLEAYNINDSATGHLYVLPLTESWFAEYRGAYLYKYISGDFVISTKVTATARDGMSLPSSTFSLAGIMIRTPINYPNQDPQNEWLPGQQNYIFMSIGQATGPRYDFEIKNTCHSSSCLDIVPIDTSTAEIRMVRRDNEIVVLSRFPGESWQVRNRYNRNGPQCGQNMNNCNAPFPDTVQIGFVVYTDWPKVSSYSTTFHNTHTLHPDTLGAGDPSPGTPFNPDIVAHFDYARFDSLIVPDSLLSADLSDESEVADSTLLQLFGYDSNPYCPTDYMVVDPIQGIYLRTRAIQTIQANNAILNQATAIFHAGLEVDLNVGFEVNLGSVFEVMLDGCGNE